MPPQISFIRLSKDTTTPIKIFTKASSANQNKSSLAINSKSLITLNNSSNYFQTRLSNNYLDNFINKLIKTNLLNVLFEISIPDLFSPVNAEKYTRITANSSTITLNHDEDKLKYTLVVPLQLVLLLRREFRRLTNADLIWLENHKMAIVDKNIRADSDINLLVKDVQFLEPNVPLEEPDVMFVPDEASEEATKKNLGYTISKVGIFNNLTNCIKIYVESNH